MKKLLGLLAVFILFISPLTSQAAIKVSPSYVEVDANKTKKDYISGSFTVAGGKDEVVRFKVYPEFFDYDSKGQFVSIADKGQKNSLMGKIKFFPQEFTCQNGLEQKIRFTITDLKALPTGESRIVLFLEDTDTKEVVIKKSNGQIGGKIILKTRVGVPVFLDKGLYSKKGNFEKLVLKSTGEDYVCEYKVSSTGNSKIRYNGTAFITQGNKLIKQFDIHGNNVEGGKSVETTQKLDVSKDDLKQGEEYKVKFVLRYQDEKQHQKILKKEVSFIPFKQEQSKI